jgi:hypothetical protein
VARSAVKRALIEAVVPWFHCAQRVREANWGRSEKMLTAAIILVFSLGALIQFAAFTWRAAFLSVATAEIPENNIKSIEMSDFYSAAAYQRLCPELADRGGSSLRSVSVYNRFLQFLSSIADTVFPVASGWAQREMVLCTRYAAVSLAQRMERNQMLAAELSSF